MIEPFQDVLIVGCGTCMTVCGAGGEREVSFLHNALLVAQVKGNRKKHTFTEYTLKRQCDPEFLETLDHQASSVEAILSLGCGIGVQALAERYPDRFVLPGVNTAFLGMAREWGVWDARCAACGDCRLAETGGICPITRCNKGIVNGPCAGPKNGKCEVSQELDCAWILIYQRLEKLQQLDNMRRYTPPRNFRPLPGSQKTIRKAVLERSEQTG